MYVTHRVTPNEIMYSVNSPGLTSLDITHYREIMPHDVNRSASMLQLTCDVGFSSNKKHKTKNFPFLISQWVVVQYPFSRNHHRHWRCTASSVTLRIHEREREKFFSLYECRYAHEIFMNEFLKMPKESFSRPSRHNIIRWNIWGENNNFYRPLFIPDADDEVFTCEEWILL